MTLLIQEIKDLKNITQPCRFVVDRTHEEINLFKPHLSIWRSDVFFTNAKIKTWPYAEAILHGF